MVIGCALTMRLKEFKLQPFTFKFKPLACTGPFQGSGKGPTMCSHGFYKNFKSDMLTS